MNSLFKTLLAIHVIIGMVGVIAYAGVWMNLLKQKLSVHFLRRASAIGLVSFLISWVSGGYYYAIYYGGAVKPIILKGDYRWAHSFFMEAKEHIFLLLPFLSAALFIALLALGERIETEEPLKRALIWLAGVIVILGIGIAFSGIIISGAVR